MLKNSAVDSFRVVQAWRLQSLRAAQFNMDKLRWLSREYIKEADDERLANLSNLVLKAEVLI